MTTRADKRERLIAAAKLRIYQQGVQKTTLADIAQESGVPLGNVYYYFQSKEALVQAVIESHLQEIRAQLLDIEKATDKPAERLKALARAGLLFADQLTQYGCPYGSLCQETEKNAQPSLSGAASLFQLYLDWAELQFHLLGTADPARDLAVDLISAIQGTNLLTNAFHNPEILERKVRRLEEWITSLT